MPEVDRITTPIDETDAAHILVNTLFAAGIKAHQAQANLLLAQLWIETAHGTVANNRNIGNLTIRDDTAQDFFRPAWFTVDASSSPNLKALNAAMLKGEAPRAFKSYPSFEAGFADYVAALKRQFPTILSAANSGDASAMAEAIKKSGYSPDAPPGTDKTLASLAFDFQRRRVFATLPLATPVAAAGQPPPGPALGQGSSPSALPSASSGSPSTHQGLPPASDALPVLRAGSTGWHVKILQRLLGCPITGTLDALTLDRVTIEQTILGVTSDGVVGPVTWGALLK